MGDIQRSGTRTLAALLTRARVDAGLTRRELAEQTGLSYPYVSQLETGYRGPSPEAMQRLTEVLGVPVHAMVEAMAERDTSNSRMSKPNPRTTPAQPSAYKKQPSWIANPTWAPTPITGAATTASSIRSRRPVRSAARRPAAPPPAAAADTPGERETLVTHAVLGASLPPPPPAIDAVVAEIVATLDELPPEQRMAALTEIQNRVVRTIVADASGPPDEPEGS